MSDSPQPPVVDLHFLDVGAGPPVVFLHGWGMSHEAFDRQIYALCGSHRVVSIDLRGHGASPKPAGTIHYEHHAADVLRVLERLDLTGVVLVGWSMGGGVAAYLAARTDRVRKLVLVGAPPRFMQEEGAPYGLPAAGCAAFMELVKTRREWVMRRTVEDTLAVQMGEAVHQWLFQLSVRCPTHAAVGCFEGVLAADVRPELKAMRQPVLLLHGVQDPYISIEAARWGAKNIPDVRLVEFERSSHAPFLEEPERFNAELLGFLSE